jgi:type III pantothenate kinase
VNIGNTRTALGLFAGEGLVAGALSSVGPRSAEELAILTRSWLEHVSGGAQAAPDVVAIASVVPPSTAPWQAAAAMLGVRRVLVYGRDGEPGIAVRMAMPANAVGADRLLNALAARRLYGAPVLVVDVGTALTLDVVGSDGAFVGGAIAAGPLTAASGLWRRAPRLTPVALGRVGRAVGRTSDEALRSGLVYGSAGQIEGLVRRARAELRAPAAPVVATGGLGPLLSKPSESVDHVEPWLTLRGLSMWAAMPTA